MNFSNPIDQQISIHQARLVRLQGILNQSSDFQERLYAKREIKRLEHEIAKLKRFNREVTKLVRNKKSSNQLPATEVETNTNSITMTKAKATIKLPDQTEADAHFGINVRKDGTMSSSYQKTLKDNDTGDELNDGEEITLELSEDQQTAILDAVTPVMTEIILADQQARNTQA